MPKALELSDSAFAAPAVPRAAQVIPPEPPAQLPVQRPARAEEGHKKKATAKAAPEEKHVPLQLRWPRSEVKAAKLATVQGDYDSVSEFMLACMHAYMQSKKA